PLCNITKISPRTKIPTPTKARSTVRSFVETEGQEDLPKKNVVKSTGYNKIGSKISDEKLLNPTRRKYGHLNCGDSGFFALISVASAGPFLSLFQIVRGEHAEDNRFAMFEADVR